MFIRKMVDYVASDSNYLLFVFILVQHGEELKDSINKVIDNVILRDV